MIEQNSTEHKNFRFSQASRLPIVWYDGWEDNMKKTMFGLALAAALSLAPISAEAEELRIGLAAIATSVDPHFHRAGYNFDLRENISDALVYANGVTGEVEPRLAASWEIA